MLRGDLLSNNPAPLHKNPREQAPWAFGDTLCCPPSTHRHHRPQPADDARERLKRLLDLRIGGVAGKTESDGTVRQSVGDVHRLQYMRRLEAAAAAGGTGAGADALLAEQQQDRLGFEMLEADVGRVGKSLIGSAVDGGLLDAFENAVLKPITQCCDTGHLRQ